VTSTAYDSGSTATLDGVVRRPQADIESLEGGPWDGRRYSYIPPSTLRLHANVELHAEFDQELDPITYQVLRSRFWHNNLEHGDVIQRIAGSALVVYAADFAVSMLTEIGDVVTIGPTIQYFSAVSDLVVKWTLENRGGQPGIRDGDIFLQNDPFIGTAQQADTALYAPVFWEGKIFAWIYNCAHIGDLGGVDAGGWAVHARDIYDEAVTIPPIKVVDRGETQMDLVEAFARQSRESEFITLGVKSQIAGIEITRRATQELLAQYGPRTVKGAMRRMIADTSKVVSERLRKIPDGSWRQRLYVGGLMGGEHGVHRETLTLTKRGDQIVCANAGTAAQGGPGNMAYGTLRSGVVAALMTVIAPDQLGCVAGVANHISFAPTPGTRTCATHPAACSAIFSTLIGVNIAALVVGKMAMSGPPELRAHANASGGMALPVSCVVYAFDDSDRYLSTSVVPAHLAGCIGAFPYRDGIDTGGSWWLLGTSTANVEAAEQDGSVLAVFRGENIDSGGPGRWRGGNGPVTAFTPHKNRVFAQMSFIEPAVNTASGLAGGAYGLGANLLATTSQSFSEAVKSGFWPGDRTALEDNAGELTRLGRQDRLAPVPKGDIVVVEWNGAGGYGDPLDRPADFVAEDVEHERVSRGAALRHYGVVLGAGTEVDVRATEDARAEIRARRLRDAETPTDHVDWRLGAGAPVLLAGAAGGVDVRSWDEDVVWACSSCGQHLGSTRSNFKDRAARADRNPHDVDPKMYLDPGEWTDPTIVLRQHCCPSCATLLSQELMLAGDESLWDFQIDSVPGEEA
jgi:N-methylhydantoinase B